MTASGRHCVFFEANESRVLVFRVLHDKWITRVTWKVTKPRTNESA